MRSMVAVGPVMLTAGCIAAAGFASLMTFGITSMRAFGLLLASGIVSALIIEMTFTPACRWLLPAPKRREAAPRERGAAGSIACSTRLARWSIDRPRTVLACRGADRRWSRRSARRASHVDNSFRLWFAPDRRRSARDDALLNEKLPGSATLRILIEGPRDDVMLRARRAARDQRPRSRDAARPAASAASPRSPITSSACTRPCMVAIPPSTRFPTIRRAIGEYLFLYGTSAGPDGLSAFVDHANRRAVIRALSKTDSAAFSRALLQHLQAYAVQRFQGLPVRRSASPAARSACRPR